ncbi:MAG: type I-E CRISPR-associated protein Cse2/CasB [bacterium]
MTDTTSPTLTSSASRAQLLGAMGRRIRDPRMSTGALASLRRGSRHDVVRQAAFHAALVDVPDHRLPAEDLVRWAAVAQCMAITGVPGSTTAHDGGALARAGLSESRFARLLASHGDGFFDQLLLIARFLHSKEASLAWRDLGELALTDDRLDERADALRLSLARDYYRALASGAAP